MKRGHDGHIMSNCPTHRFVPSASSDKSLYTRNQYNCLGSVEFLSMLESLLPVHYSLTFNWTFQISWTTSNTRSAIEEATPTPRDIPPAAVIAVSLS